MSAARPVRNDKYGNRVSKEEKEAVDLEGETFPALDPFVLLEHAERNDYKYDIHLNEEDGIHGVTVFQNPDYAENGLYKGWKLSYSVKVDENDKSLIEVKFDPQSDNYRDGQQIWERIIETLEERTERYHTEIKQGVAV